MELTRRVISFGRRPTDQPKTDTQQKHESNKASELTRRVLSFGRRSKDEPSKDENISSNHPRRRTSLKLQAVGDNIVRNISFGQKGKQHLSQRAREVSEHIREVVLHKASTSDTLGVTLYTPSIVGLAPEGNGVTVAQVARDSIAARKLQPGDLLLAINGVAVANHKEASEALRAATGVIQLVLAPARPLPDGWKTRVDAKGEVEYVHSELNAHTPFHPAGMDMTRLFSLAEEESDGTQPPAKSQRGSMIDSPRKQLKGGDAPGAASRWRRAFHKVSMVNVLTGETEPRDRRSIFLAVDPEHDDEEGVLQPRGNSHAVGAPAAGVLQHERV